jgi:hypothetical protein
MGNLVVWFVGGAIADQTAVKAATELGAATTYRITHSFLPDGWPLVGSQESNPDDRLTLMQSLESLGKITQTFGDGIKYVDSSAAGSAAVVLKPVSPAITISGFFVERRGISNTVVAAAAQKGRVIPVTLGLQMPTVADGNGKFAILQKVSITGPIVNSVFAA